MTALNSSTRRRLLELPQISSVWEGDRRPLSAGLQASGEWLDIGPHPGKTDGECILWVDGSHGVVRAMDVVTPETGPEALVRTLLRAMEHPHSPGKPARPQKIVVQDREIQFFLRGALQELNITIDYVPELPLIDEIFRSFQDVVNTRPPQLPPQYAQLLTQKAQDIWQTAPWEMLADHQILAIELNQWDVEAFYVCVMGMLGMEYGILLYRSLESLKRFRQQVLTNESPEQMEEAFLGQDCLFMSFESDDDDPEANEDLDLADLPDSAIRPAFGNLHPLEGLRSFLYEEEALALLVSLEALKRFFNQHRSKLAQAIAEPITSRYRIPVPQTADAKSILSVKVSTLPDISTELLEMASDIGDEDLPILRDDLIPESSFLSLGMVPWEMLEQLRAGAEYYQPGQATAAGDGLPVVLVQTSRPKAKTLIEEIQAAGGLKAICFNPGEDPLGGDRYDLGLLQLGNGELCLFGEFEAEDPTHKDARKKWEQRCKKTKGYCGLVVARKAKGAVRGNPQSKDMVALFEAQAISSEELGLGPLQLQLEVDWV